MNTAILYVPATTLTIIYWDTLKDAGYMSRADRFLLRACFTAVWMGLLALTLLKIWGMK